MILFFTIYNAFYHEYDVTDVHIEYIFRLDIPSLGVFSSVKYK